MKKAPEWQVGGDPEPTPTAVGELKEQAGYCFQSRLDGQGDERREGSRFFFQFFLCWQCRIEMCEVELKKVHRRREEIIAPSVYAVIEINCTA